MFKAGCVFGLSAAKGTWSMNSVPRVNRKCLLLESNNFLLTHDKHVYPVRKQTFPFSNIILELCVQKLVNEHVAIQKSDIPHTWGSSKATL